MSLEHMAHKGMADVAGRAVGAKMSRSISALLKDLARTQQAMGIQQRFSAGQ